jgi:hypothetical protein
VAAKSLAAPVARNGNRTEPPRAGEANGTSRRGAVTPIRTTPAPAEASTDRGNDSVAVEEDPAAETSGGEMDPAADQEPVRPRPVSEIIAMGDEFREAGDVEWARRLYRAAKERGSGKAATALAETYDPLYTAASSRASAEEARHLYETAVKLGDRSATRRLQDLEAWEEERPVER